MELYQTVFEQTLVKCQELVQSQGGRKKFRFEHPRPVVEILDAEKQETIVFLTNLLAFGATTIAAIYKDRWQVELLFENSTWCTPLDVMGFRGPIALNRPLVGLLNVQFGDAWLDVRAAQYPGCTHTGLRRRQLFQPNQPQDSGRCDAECGGTFTDGHLVAGLPLSLTVDRNRMVITQRADALRSPLLSVCRTA